MDYKKKYEKALERAKVVNPGTTDYNIVTKIFPELKESEDERMRKMAIHAVYSPEAQSCIKSWGVEPKDVIAWLEKQGEQSNKVSIWKHWNNGVAGNGEGKPVYLVKSGNTYSLRSCLVFECDYIELSELDKLYVEKQCEQKPAWGEEDEKMYNAILDTVDKDLGLVSTHRNWFRNIKNRIQPQPKQEWSEEDERYFRSSHCYLNEFGNLLSSKNEEKSLSRLNKIK